MGEMFSSTTVKGFTASLVIHISGFAAFFGMSGWLGGPVLLMGGYSGRNQPAIEVSWAAPVSHPVDEAEPPVEFDVEPEPARLATETHAPTPGPGISGASNIAVAANENEIVSPDPIARQSSTPARGDDLKVASASHQPRRAVSHAAATPSVAEVPLPTAPFLFVGSRRYTAEALPYGWEGTVVVLVHLDSGGYVVRVKVDTSSGLPAADAEAVRIVQAWRAVPLHAGEPLTTKVVRYPIQFSPRGVGR